ncbi:MAG TPA: hypothetical protein PLJ29_04010, partial [Leptospiraceae bacterium]|nr:hypothetical protein [Leptospiraceae bacterium]
LDPLTMIANMENGKKDCDITFSPRSLNTFIGKTFGVVKEGEKTVELDQVFASIKCKEIKRFLTVLWIPEKKTSVRFLFPDYSHNEEASFLTEIKKDFPSEVYESRRDEWIVDYPTGENKMLFIFSKEKPDFLSDTVGKAGEKQILSDNDSIIELGEKLVKKIQVDLKNDKQSHFINVYNCNVTETERTEKKESTEGL